LKKFVKGQIDGAQVNPQTAEDTLTFLLPTQNKSTLLPLFEHLEKDPTITLDLAMTSLEEAFINIGMDEEKFMNRTRRISHQQ
jgi:ATP-binding cassette subfamily A (ABC1) protein 3